MRRAAALLAVFFVLALLHTWPLASAPGSLTRLDNSDTALNTWIVAWVQHILPRDPLRLFDAPIFFPERHTLAYSEHLLVPALMGAPLAWLGLSPVLVYNLLLIAGFAFTGWTMCLVVERWTGSAAAGVMAGSLFAFNAHSLTRLAHLQALHAEFYPIALLALDRVLTESDPRRVRRAGVLLAVAFVLQALCSNYAMVFLGTALVVAGLVRAPEWLGRGRSPRAITLALALLASAIVLLPFLWPYYVVRRDVGLTRSLDEVRRYSAGLLDYLTTAGRLHYAWWSHRFFEGRTALFPGLVATVLAAGAVAVPGALRDARIRMTVAIGLVGFALSFGPALPGYAWLHAGFPLLQGIRGAARWGGLLLMAVAILAGYAVAWLQRSWAPRAYWPAIFAALLGAVTIEAMRTPMSLTQFTGIPAIYDTLRNTPNAVVAEWPMYAGDVVSRNARYMVASTQTFYSLVNGYSGFEPASFRDRARAWEGFPSGEVLDDMIRTGVTHLILHVRDLSERVVEEAAASPRLVRLADDGERRIYMLRVE